MSTGLKANSDGSAAIQVGGTDVITLTSGGAATFVTSPTTVQAGTAAAPSITTSGDTNTGIFFPAADTIAFTEGGVESMRIDSSGNVGIGTSSPGARLDVSTGTTNRLRVSESSSQLFFDSLNAGATAWSAKVERATTLSWLVAPSGTPSSGMQLDSSGNLGLGVTPAAWRTGSDKAFQIGAWMGLFTDSGVTSEITYNTYVSSSNTFVRLNTGSATRYRQYLGAHDWFTAGSSSAGSTITFGDPKMTLDANGNLLVGKTSTSDAVVGVSISPAGAVAQSNAASTNATVVSAVYSTGASNYRFYVGMAGTVYATSTTITAISDQRLKENIQDIDAGLDKIMALKPRKFDWKEGKGKDTKGDRGWIAQEFEQVFPEMIDTWLDPAPEGEEPYKAVNADLIPVLVKAVQEQQAMIDELKAKVAALEGA